MLCHRAQRTHVTMVEPRPTLNAETETSTLNTLNTLITLNTRKETETSNTRLSRRHLASPGAVAFAIIVCTALIQPEAASAMTMRTLKRALVNLVRVREGSALLQRRLDENLLSGFQDGVKLLVSDTNLSENVRLALQGLVELDRQSSLKIAEEKGDKIVQFISQVVEYDGWDKMNRMDIREKFQAMTPEKIAFAKRGLTEVRKEIDGLFSLFPPELIVQSEELYQEIYAVK